MSDLESLDSIFNNEPVKGEPEPETLQEEPVQEQEPPAQDSTPESEEQPKEEESWTKAAVLDERRKRQELERKLAELEAKKEEPKRPDVFEDPDGAFSHLEQQFNQKLLNERISLSRAMMEERHADYAEKEQVFIEMTKDSPELVRKMQEHPFPAKFAYEQATKHQEFKQMQDIDAYKAKMREEVKVEILKELESERTKKATKDSLVETPSLSKTRSAKDEPFIEKSLEETFGR